jgi:hypothetical protein
LNPTQGGNNALIRPLYYHRDYIYITYLTISITLFI